MIKIPSKYTHMWSGHQGNIRPTGQRNDLLGDGAHSHQMPYIQGLYIRARKTESAQKQLNAGKMDPETFA